MQQRSVRFDALEAGDPSEAQAILLELVQELTEPMLRVGVIRPNTRCPSCGLDCEWPGRLDDHLRNVHRVAA